MRRWGLTAAEPSQYSPRTGRTTRLPRHARRRQLLGAAREVFVAQGYHAAAMDEIAERAGVSKPVLYQHFPGKLELYLALLDEHAGQLVTRVHAALASTTDNHLRIARSFGAYFDFVDDPTGAYQLVFESDLRSEPAVRERIEQSFSSCVTAISATIAEDTALSEREAELLSVGMIGLAETGARWWLVSQAAATREGDDNAGGPSPRDPIEKQRAVDLLVELAWRGIAGSPLRETPGGFAPGAPTTFGAAAADRAARGLNTDSSAPPAGADQQAVSGERPEVSA
ncbi:MAG: TetR/AcrR family transcriptional regulator [Frankia sp.]